MDLFWQLLRHRNTKVNESVEQKTTDRYMRMIILLIQADKFLLLCKDQQDLKQVSHTGIVAAHHKCHISSKQGIVNWLSDFSEKENSPTFLAMGRWECQMQY